MTISRSELDNKLNQLTFHAKLAGQTENNISTMNGVAEIQDGNLDDMQKKHLDELVESNNFHLMEISNIKANIFTSLLM